MTRRALLVEDDASIATVITAGLEAEAFTVDRCDSVSGRDRLLAEGGYDVMLTDVLLTDGDGIATLGDVHSAYPDMPVIILSAQNTLDTAVRATETGAFEYFPKPFDLEELVRTACQAADSRAGIGAQSDDPGDGLPLIGRSQPMQEVYRMISSPRRSISSAHARPVRSWRSTPRRFRAS
jgi:two-component system nitrogen regulation response regulator GlnG